MNQQASIMQAKYASLDDEPDSSASDNTHQVSDDGAIGLRASLKVDSGGSGSSSGSSSSNRSAKRGGGGSVVEEDRVVDSHSDSSDEFHDVTKTALSTAVVASEKNSFSDRKRQCVSEVGAISSVL
jgi:hypothetical protein